MNLLEIREGTYVYLRQKTENTNNVDADIENHLPAFFL